MKKRKAVVERATKETKIKLELNLDGQGKFIGRIGIGFLEHMLQLFAYHGRFDLKLEAQGDLQVDAHHTIEDIGICLGQALNKALSDKKGIERFGTAFVPMEDSLASCVVDISNRPLLIYNVKTGKEKIGDYDTELTEEFFRALVVNARLTMHINLYYGRNAHHIQEAIFKSVGRALRKAVRIDPTFKEVPSTKGEL